MKRRKDVEELLEYVKTSLVTVKTVYDQSLELKEIPGRLCVQVKNVMENLRSALDYMALDVYESLPNQKNSKPKIYFPYGKDKVDFDSMVKKYFSSLEVVNPDIYFLLENMQPYKQGSTWLCDLCQITNDHKHDSLTPQIRTSKKTYSVSRAGVSLISAPAHEIQAGPGDILFGEIPIIFDPKTGIPQQTPGLDIEVITWVSFMFQGTKIEVYPFLLIAFQKVSELSKNLYEMLKDVKLPCPSL